MTAPNRGVAVLLVQLLLISTVGTKYAWERYSCPRVWTRATQFDPQMPIRGRYLALQLEIDACGLKNQTAAHSFGWNTPVGRSYPAKEWTVVAAAENGKLMARLAGEYSLLPKETVVLPEGTACQHAKLSQATDFFIPEHARTPFPLPAGQELWVEVTVPPSGPPRPVLLAVSDAKGFRKLDLR